MASKQQVRKDGQTMRDTLVLECLRNSVRGSLAATEIQCDCNLGLVEASLKRLIKRGEVTKYMWRTRRPMHEQVRYKSSDIRKA